MSYPQIHRIHKERRKKEAKKEERKELLLRLLSRVVNYSMRDMVNFSIDEYTSERSAARCLQGSLEGTSCRTLPGSYLSMLK